MATPFFISKPDLIELFLSQLRSCSLCYRQFQFIDFFCQDCWSKIIAEYRLYGRNLDCDLPFPVYSALQWTPNTKFNPVGELIHGFKQGRLKLTSKRLAEIILTTRICAPLPPQKLIFIPAPAKNPKKLDHAGLLAQSLANLACGEVIQPLGRGPSHHHQRSLHLEDRLKTKLHLMNSEQLKDQQKSRIVFVDDVLTSGSTALAAYEALQKPVNFEVWTIAYRAKLA